MGTFGTTVNLVLNVIFVITLSYNVCADINLNELSTCELEQLARQILDPDSGYELHASALRNQLKNLIQANLNQNSNSLNDGQQYYDDSDDYVPDKRNLAAIARLGLVRPSPSQDDIKRSIATLAKNGQLPSREPEAEDLSESQWNNYKRNIGSIARSGNIVHHKRSNGSSGNEVGVPVYLYPFGKRSLQSILRSGGSSNGQQQQRTTSSVPKRNVAALARDNLFPRYEKRDVNAANQKNPPENEKRNIGSIKNSRVHGGKAKRDISYDDFPDDSETLNLVYQNNPANYEELREMLSEIYPSYPDTEIHTGKRYLGRVLPPTRATSSTNRRRL